MTDIASGIFRKRLALRICTLCVYFFWVCRRNADWFYGAARNAPGMRSFRDNDDLYPEFSDCQSLFVRRKVSMMMQDRMGLLLAEQH